MSREKDTELLLKLPTQKIPDFIYLHLRNLWAVDGLYFLGIEEAYGTEKATQIDQHVWEIMGKLEARKLREFLDIKGTDIASLMTMLSYSSWALDLEDKEIIVEKHRALIRNVDCRVQNTRINKGLKEFGCKPVRLGFLKAFTQEFNPAITVTCHVCPPDAHPKDVWCEWEFTMKGK